MQRFGIRKRAGGPPDMFQSMDWDDNSSNDDEQLLSCDGNAYSDDGMDYGEGSKPSKQKSSGLMKRMFGGRKSTKQSQKQQQDEEQVEELEFPGSEENLPAEETPFFAPQFTPEFPSPQKDERAISPTAFSDTNTSPVVTEEAEARHKSPKRERKSKVGSTASPRSPSPRKSKTSSSKEPPPSPSPEKLQRQGRRRSFLGGRMKPEEKEVETEPDTSAERSDPNQAKSKDKSKEKKKSSSSSKKDKEKKESSKKDKDKKEKEKAPKRTVSRRASIKNMFGGGGNKNEEEGLKVFAPRMKRRASVCTGMPSQEQTPQAPVAILGPQFARRSSLSTAANKQMEALVVVPGSPRINRRASLDNSGLTGAGLQQTVFGTPPESRDVTSPHAPICTEKCALKSSELVESFEKFDQFLALRNKDAPKTGRGSTAPTRKFKGKTRSHSTDDIDIVGSSKSKSSHHRSSRKSSSKSSDKHTESAGSLPESGGGRRGKSPSLRGNRSKSPSLRGNRSKSPSLRGDRRRTRSKSLSGEESPHKREGSSHKRGGTKKGFAQLSIPVPVLSREEAGELPDESFNPGNGDAILDVEFEDFQA